MDFGTLLEDVQSLKHQFSAASEMQNGALDTLKSGLEQHYAELEQQVETLKTMQQDAARQLAMEQSDRIDALQRAQSDRIDALQREQNAFVQEQGAKTEAILRGHGELSADMETARKAAGETTEKLAAQAEKLEQMKRASEANLQALYNQTSDQIGKVKATFAELQTALARQDQTKAVEELLRRLESLKNETGAAASNLGGQIEKVRAQQEQIKEAQRALSRSREGSEHLSQRADKLEENVNTLRAKVRELASREAGPGGGGSGGNSRIGWIALGLGLLAIFGLALGGFFLQRAQNEVKAELQQQLIDLQATNAATLQELNDEIAKLTTVVNATPAPSPEPTPAPEPTPLPTESANAEVTPNP